MSHDFLGESRLQVEKGVDMSNCQPSKNKINRRQRWEVEVASRVSDWRVGRLAARAAWVAIVFSLLAIAFSVVCMVQVQRLIDRMGELPVPPAVCGPEGCPVPDLVTPEHVDEE